MCMRGAVQAALHVEPCQNAMRLTRCARCSAQAEPGLLRSFLVRRVRG